MPEAPMVSVAIITKNEEDNIGDCLESVKWADEIIVVDSGSDDGTADICEGYGVRFYTEPWKGFSAQKNSAIEKATKDWILSLDADERVTPELREEITALCESGTAKNGYFIPRKNFFLGRWIRHCGWYPDYTLRLIKRGKGSFGEREVHESLSVRGDTGHLKHPMEHYTYKTISDYLKRLDRYSTLAARELQKEKKRYGIHHIVFRPLYTFFHMYVIRLGFLDGYFGLMLSILYSFYTFSKYIKLQEFQVTEQ
jgi:glycosyltransferase involved in cell wall biosynthesis